ncbi:MAG TPA: hypothetical protein VFK38_03850 [Candidatus Limnocylindrales bacterium]|nr:hypothetical protein [Candidatus Limnocylindrales bacterium]
MTRGPEATVDLAGLVPLLAVLASTVAVALLVVALLARGRRRRLERHWLREAEPRLEQRLSDLVAGRERSHGALRQARPMLPHERPTQPPPPPAPLPRATMAQRRPREPLLPDLRRRLARDASAALVVFGLLGSIGLALLGGGGDGMAPASSDRPTGAVLVTPTAGEPPGTSASATLVAQPTPAPTPPFTGDQSPTPAAPPSGAPTATASPAPARTPRPTRRPARTPAATPSPSPTPSPTPSATATAPLPTPSPSPTPLPTPSATATAPLPTPTPTPEPTPTPTGP